VLLLISDYLNGLFKLFKFWINLYITRRKNLISKGLRPYVLFIFHLEMKNETLLFIYFDFLEVFM